MDTAPFGRTVGHGALAGAVAGGAGAAIMYWLVEPSIRAAIAIEESGEAADADPAGHAHGAQESAEHSHAVQELVSRDQQVWFGLLTVVVVGVLIGIAFALAHRFLRHRLPGSGSPVASVMALAGLGFVCLTLVPAVVVPANPPAVGAAGTVDTRTLTYVGAIVGAIVLSTLVVATARARNLAPGTRALAATFLGIVGAAVLVWALPHTSDPVPPTVPADLIWNFRVASLAQLGVMWLVLGAVFASLRAAGRRAPIPQVDQGAYWLRSVGTRSR